MTVELSGEIVVVGFHSMQTCCHFFAVSMFAMAVQLKVNEQKQC